jgi:electron transport complex protein RnfC
MPARTHRTDFSLLSSVEGQVQEGPRPEPGDLLHVPLDGHAARVECGQAVAADQTVAEHPSPDRGDAHAPVDGVVHELSCEHVSIRHQPDADLPAPPEPAQDLAGLDARELARALKGLGVDTRGLRPAAWLVVNAMNPEPRVSVHQQIALEFRESLDAGLDAARTLVRPEETALVVPSGSAMAFSKCMTVHQKPAHPNGLDPMAVKAATGRESPDDAACIGLLELYLMGRAMRTGRPVTETVATVGHVNYRVLVGTPLRTLLQTAGGTLRNGDRLIMGGPMCGRAAYSPEQGVPKDLRALSLVAEDAFPPVDDGPCLNCGECAMACPARIRPNAIASMAEFRLFDRVRDEHPLACMECGLCGYHCVARRPLLQYIRMAKQELLSLPRLPEEAA